MILRDARGFTLPEVLLTVFIIGIGIAAIMSVIPVGAYGVQEGKQLSTATFLADQRLEQIRKLPWVKEPAGFPPDALPANDCLGLSQNAPPRVPGPAPAPPCFFETTGLVRAAVGQAVPDPNVPGRLLLADEDPTGTSATGIPGFGGYLRRVRVTDCAAGGCAGVPPPNAAGMRLVTVTVTYTPLTAGGVSPAQKSVTLNMVIAQR
ncbi:MAG: type IV pilus modification PilV family protein [Candidatus Rokuibacteriota bacterium]